MLWVWLRVREGPGNATAAGGHNEEGTERGLGQRLCHPQRAYVTVAPSLAVATGPQALPGLPIAPYPCGGPGQGPLPMATGRGLGWGGCHLTVYPWKGNCKLPAHLAG